jgi:AbrB family looped-hinge helix DNA binding protein
MRRSIDRWGRVVVPKVIRDRLGLVGGEQLSIEEQDGVITLRPSLVSMQIIATDEGAVAEPVTDQPPLSDEVVRETLERSRR